MQRSWLLDPRRKTLEHLVELALVIVVLILTGIYLNMGIRPTRSEIMVIPIGVKSIIIIGYQLLSEHTARFSRWRSPKANTILNCIEVVFWLAAIIVKFMGVSRTCTGNSCAVNVIILLVALSIL
ncbi:hypothetical protein NEMBOFW57_010891 [Staphylotrichum longicolle]|uniref:Uncharacterized protein n=1 Tax=Staphylotrichum longicolle TaxID=669026 RepID=A0AAD4ENK3_9PEZI|nr:hypothetical protein NEMBOFW57_010891 [Staphylotrichum longicolle]